MPKQKNQTIPIKKNELLEQAFTHRSWLNENNAQTQESNERLEFLGDAVLELVVTKYLYENFPQEQEGTLTALRAALVRTETLAKVANKLKLGKRLRLSRGEEVTGGRQNQSLLADTFEALIGAIYLESGKSKVTSFLKKHLLPELKTITKNQLEKDAKSMLQELVQARSLPAPIYKIIKESGPDHKKTFTIEVLINKQRLASGVGKSKQQAQQQAAQAALEKKNLI